MHYCRHDRTCKIDVSELMDYCFCPKYYYYHQQKGYHTIKDAYDIAIRQCFRSYLYAKQNGGDRNGLDYLKKMWGKLWIRQKTNSSIIMTPSSSKRDTYDQKRKNGIDAIFRFYESIGRQEQFPIIIDQSFEIKIGSDIILTGTWDYIRECKDEYGSWLELIKYRTESNRFFVSEQVHSDLSVTASAYAFEKTFISKQEPLKLYLMDFFHQKKIETVRTAKDYKMFERTVTDVVKSIQEQRCPFSPDYRCFHCEFRKKCL